ncbi:MAG: M20/M25/M40 family metallo-hydrolase [Actinomycetota bacterium]|nr:M20/M25/M40 family metallo-hydrolase [Actinomycetota bacterium]
MKTGAIEGRTGSNAAQAMVHVRRLCDCGDRFAGQPGDAPAAQYVEDCLKSYGLEIERTPAELVSFRERSCRVELADGTQLDATSAYYSPATLGPLEVPAVYIGSGSEADYAGKDVRGSVVILEETALNFDLFWLGEFCERAAKKGAVGLIAVHPFPWSYRMSLEFGTFGLDKRFAEPSVPAVAVSATSALRLLSALAAGEELITFDVQTDNEPCVSDHIAGVLRGSIRPDDRVIVLAHRDIPVPPGANDNGSGTATILELARMLCDQPLDCSVVFLSVAGEEGRAEGTAKYIDALGEAIGSVKAAISVDMIAAGGPLRLVDRIHWPDRDPETFTPWLTEMLEASAASLGYQLERYQTTSGADAGRFLAAGVPSAWFWKPDDYRYHSVEDQPYWVDANAIKAAAEIIADTIIQLGNRP